MIALLKFVPWWTWPMLILALFGGVQTFRVHLDAADLSACQAKSSALVSAQQDNLVTISALQKANDDWAAKDAANMTRAAAMVTAAMDESAKNQRAAAAAQQQLKVIYGHQSPAVQACGNQLIPAAATKQLRDFAASH